MRPPSDEQAVATVHRLEHARAMREARMILKASIQPGAPIWKRRIRYDWQTGFKRDVLVELLPNLELRVTDVWTGDVLVQGPASPGHSDQAAPTR